MALASGLPLLCRADGALEGMLEQDKNGLIYHSEEEFGDYAARILGDGMLRADMGRYSSLKAEDFSSDSFADAMLSVYADAIIKRKKTNRTGGGQNE
jgi:1,2-diacylglycerol 3-alpha-glucosyltransferase